MTTVEVKFSDRKARIILMYLRAKYGMPNASLNTLAKIAILRAHAEQAQKELDEAEKAVFEPVNRFRPKSRQSNPGA